MFEEQKCKMWINLKKKYGNLRKNMGNLRVNNEVCKEIYLVSRIYPDAGNLWQIWSKNKQQKRTDQESSTGHLEVIEQKAYIRDGRGRNSGLGVRVVGYESAAIFKGQLLKLPIRGVAPEWLALNSEREIQNQIVGAEPVYERQQKVECNGKVIVGVQKKKVGQIFLLNGIREEEEDVPERSGLAV